MCKNPFLGQEGEECLAKLSETRKLVKNDPLKEQHIMALERDAKRIADSRRKLLEQQQSLENDNPFEKHIRALGEDAKRIADFQRKLLEQQSQSSTAKEGQEDPTFAPSKSFK